MAIYAISDLHLSLGTDKPMDVFGDCWQNYVEKIQKNWIDTIGPDDTVIIPGDISWATYLEDTEKDFAFIESLPGIKVFLKGNHDYWWSTASKMKRFLASKKFYTIDILHNNSVMVSGNAICGTRGWKNPEDNDFTQEDQKIYARELNRLELSLQDGIKKEPDRIIVALHFPPFGQQSRQSELIELMNKYGVNICLYGHLHGDALKTAFTGNIYGIEFKPVSADYLEFKPALIQ